jgi:hypothetical protein
MKTDAIRAPPATGSNESSGFFRFIFEAGVSIAETFFIEYVVYGMQEQSQEIHRKFTENFALDFIFGR